MTLARLAGSEHCEMDFALRNEGCAQQTAAVERAFHITPNGFLQLEWNPQG